MLFYEMWMQHTCNHHSAIKLSGQTSKTKSHIIRTVLLMNGLASFLPHLLSQLYSKFVDHAVGCVVGTEGK